MSFNSDFDRAFMERSLELVKQYRGPYDATLLLNCLLGLLIVPKEACIHAIPKDPISNLRSWGISPDSIKDFGHSNSEDSNPRNLRGLVWHLRNAVAHFRFEPRPTRGEVKAFHFSDESGFRATVKLDELRVFVERLAYKLKEM
jgi:HEPN pEK499 p136